MVPELERLGSRRWEQTARGENLQKMGGKVMNKLYGTRVKFTERLRRVEGNKERTWPSGRTTSVSAKEWVARPYCGEGIFLGTRCLKNGYREWENDVGWVFTPEKHFIAALVSPGPTENPVYIPLDNIIKEESDV